MLRPAPSRALLVVVGLLWSGLCLALDAAGHAPSRPPLPVTRWYRVQALLLPVLVPAMGELAARLAAWRLQRRGVPPLPSDPAALRVALGLGLGGFVVGDTAAWALLGFDQLAPASAALGLGAVVGMVALSTALLRRATLPTGRAAAIAALSLALSGAAGSVLLR